MLKICLKHFLRNQTENYFDNLSLASDTDQLSGTQKLATLEISK